MRIRDLLKQLVRMCLPITTDQKVGGSSPSERAQLSGRFRSWKRPLVRQVQQRNTAVDPEGGSRATRSAASPAVSATLKH
jgi:hypothetical protein